VGFVSSRFAFTLNTAMSLPTTPEVPDTPKLEQAAEMGVVETDGAETSYFGIRIKKFDRTAFGILRPEKTGHMGPVFV
jgi:hypothetical protein